MSLSASGLTVQTQSVLSILIGGVAFETPATGPVLAAAEANTNFTLHGDRVEAFKLPARDPQTYLLVFKQSVRGLASGAAVEFKGIPIGEVTDVVAQFDEKTYEFSVSVLIRLDPARLGVKLVGTGPDDTSVAAHRKVIDALVAQGVRGQLQTGSLLTGGLFVALDVFPDAAPTSVDWSKDPAELPTIAGELEAIEASVVNIIKKIDQLPFKEIGADLQKTLVSARTTLDNAGKLIEPNSPLDQQLDSTLQEVSRAARGLRTLADYLERHPEALIRGKTGEGK